MKAVAASFVVALVLAGGAFATGSALDPRVPALKHQIAALSNRVAAVEISNSNKIDKNCVGILPIVIRPGYVYQLTNGQLVIYKAFDEWDPSTDSSHNNVMTYNC